MTVNELQKKLKEIGVKEDMYSLMAGGFPNEAYCLTKNGDKWEVYYSERGKKRGDKIFNSESAACEYLLGKLEKCTENQSIQTNENEKEKQRWITRIYELTDEIGIMDVSLNALEEGDFIVGYYYNDETGKYDVYQNEERGGLWIRKSTIDEVDALKKVYFIVSAIAETTRRELREKCHIDVESEDLRATIEHNIFEDGNMEGFVSQPVIYMQDEKYYIAVFIYSYSEKELNDRFISRPFGWVLADLATGDVVQQYQCKEKDFSDASYDKKYDFRLNGEHDTSKEYYYKTYGFLEYTRAGILSTGEIPYGEYKLYMKRILANVPTDYQRFYLDLSIKMGQK